MKNSDELCLPLSLPFACITVDSRDAQIPEETLIHYYTEIFVIREGRLRITMNRKEQIVGPGETVVICPGTEHSVALVGEEPMRMNLLRLDPDRLPEQPVYMPSLEAIFAEAARGGMPMIISAEDGAELHLPEMSAMCIDETEKQAFGYDIRVVSLLSLFCVALVRFWISKGLALGGREVQMDPIYSLSGYIQNHLTQNLRVEDLAARCGLSYPWFAKKFREIYGVSCKDYIEQIRVAKVEQLLLFTCFDLTRISEMTGYADCSHMIKNFKRIMNITPGQYRLKRK